MHASIHRYLSDKQYAANIKADDRFRYSRDVLSAKMKELKIIGKSNKPRAASAFTPDEIDSFLQHQLLGAG
jgi:hypothetical protein